MKRFKIRTVHGAFSQIAGRTEELVNQEEFVGYELTYIYEINLTGDAHALLMVFEAVDYDERETLSTEEEDSEPLNIELTDPELEPEEEVVE